MLHSALPSFGFLSPGCSHPADLVHKEWLYIPVTAVRLEGYLEMLKQDPTTLELKYLNIHFL